jgi:cytochrome c oxidase assembly factor CtaG
MIHHSWLFEGGILAATAIYLHGWFGAVPLSRLMYFVGGLAILWTAACSPLAMLDEDLLTAHMVQHLLIMLAAAPLVLLGAPGIVFWRVMPAPPLLRRIGALLAHPIFCWLAGTVTVIVWHVPVIFEAARKSSGLHAVECASFFAAGLLFWWPVVEPWPCRPRWPRWSIPLYLFFATMPCDALSAFLAFSGRLVYPHYLSVARPLGMTALQDQELAGALMWTVVTFAYLAPAAVLTVRLLSPAALNPDLETRAVRYQRPCPETDPQNPRERPVKHHHAGAQSEVIADLPDPQRHDGAAYNSGAQDPGERPV